MLAQLRSLETMMGNPHANENVFSHAHVMRLDEGEIFPETACQKLNQWGLSHFYVPQKQGGKLTSFETLFGLLRLIARRDITIAIAHAKTYLGASIVWVGGSAEQKRRMAALILQGRVISLALTEKDHGSDLLSSEVFAKKIGKFYSLSGEKWLINNATRGHAMTVFAKMSAEGVTGPSHSARSYAVFFVNQKNLPAEAYRIFPKIKTHGVRGADISGICFQNAKLDKAALVGKAGSGIDLVLKSLQISRTLCTALSLGAADTALRTTLKFTLHRKLYGKSMLEIPHVKSELVYGLLDLLTAEAMTSFAVRSLHVCPEMMSLYSSVVKYYVPTAIESLFDRLSSLLGARFYLREEHDHGIFQKFMRDNSLVALFDGSTLVNLQNIANQINTVIKQQPKSLDGFDAYQRIFDSNIPCDTFNPALLCLFSYRKDLISYSFEWVLDKFCHARENRDPELIRLIKILIIERNRLFERISKRSYFYEKIDKEKELNLKAYCALVAAACCLGMLTFHPVCGNEIKHILMKNCLIRLVAQISGQTDLLQEINFDPIATHLEALYHNHQLFSLDPMSLGEGSL